MLVASCGEITCQTATQLYQTYGLDILHLNHHYSHKMELFISYWFLISLIRNEIEDFFEHIIAL
jgi:hypothetical protein